MIKKFILGKKVGMTEFITEDGIQESITVVMAGPLHVLEICEKEKQGYHAVKVGYQVKKESKLTKPESGLFKKTSAPPLKYVMEFRGEFSYKAKDIIDVNVFEIGDKVDVCGKTAGRGFSGTIKRWNCHRGPMTHGSKSHRITGSIGGGADPGRVLKGTKMPGQYGGVNVTIKNLEVLRINAEENLIYIRGSVPGKKDSLLKITARG